MTHELPTQGGDYLTPAYEHARVADAMRFGVFSCRASTPLTTVARMMATNHVHSVVVIGREVDMAGELHNRAWGIVTDVDLMRAVDAFEDLTAGYIATSDVRTVKRETPLSDAAHTMARERLSHLIVVDSHDGQPIGVLSSLDIAGNLAWARG